MGRPRGCAVARANRHPGAVDLFTVQKATLRTLIVIMFDSPQPAEEA